MQIKPHFVEYKEIKKTPFMKDDRGVLYNMVRYWGKYYGYKKNSFKKELLEKENTTILGNKLNKYSNGATGYDDEMFFKFNSKKLPNFWKPKEIDEYLVYLVYAGETTMFDPYPSPLPATGFRIYPLLIKDNK